MKFNWEEFQVLQPSKALALQKEYENLQLQASPENLEFELVEGAVTIWKAVDRTAQLRGPWFFTYPRGWIR